MTNKLKKDQQIELKKEQHLSELQLIKKLIKKGTNCIIESNTNTGKTWACLNEAKSSGHNFIFAVDCKLLADQLGTKYKIPVFYKGKVKPHSNCITLYNHVDLFKDPDTILFVDEFHSIYKDYSYKSDVIDKMMNCFDDYKQVIGLTGTPMGRMTGFENVQIISKREQRTINHISSDDYLEHLLFYIINNPGKIHYISIFDKSDEALRIVSFLQTVGFKEDEIAQINSETKDTEPFKELVSKCKTSNQKIILTTYTQGFNIEGKDYMLHIIPRKGACHSPEDIEQVVNRFRDETPIVNLYWKYQDNYQSTFDEGAEQIRNIVEAKLLIDWWEKEFQLTSDNLNQRKSQVIKNHLKAENIGIIRCNLKPNDNKIISNIHMKRTSEMYLDMQMMKNILFQTGYSLYSKDEINGIIKTNPDKAKEIRNAIETYKINKQKERLKEIHEDKGNDYPNDELAIRYRHLLKYFPEERSYEILLKILLNKKEWNKLVKKLSITNPQTLIDKGIKSALYSQFEVGGKYTSSDIYNKFQNLYRELGLERIASPTKATQSLNEYFVTKRCKISGTIGRVTGIEIVEKVSV